MGRVSKGWLGWVSRVGGLLIRSPVDVHKRSLGRSRRSEAPSVDRVVTMTDARLVIYRLPATAPFCGDAGRVKRIC